MRLLSAYELDLVAGGNGSSDSSQLNGNDNYDGSWFGAGDGGGGYGSSGNLFGHWSFTPVYVGVTAVGYGTGSYGWNGYWNFVPDSSSGASTGGGPASGSDSGGVVPHAPETPCEKDAMEDSIAVSVADQIKLQSDWSAREYGALIVRYADGSYGVTALASGETFAEAQARATAAGQSAFAPELHYNFSSQGGAVIVGAIHSHPDIGYSPADDIENQYPSDYVGGGDYWNFDQMVGHDARFVSSPSEFTHYILGPDGILREFNLANGHVNHSNDTNPASRANLAADRPCG